MIPMGNPNPWTPTFNLDSQSKLAIFIWERLPFHFSIGIKNGFDFLKSYLATNIENESSLLFIEAQSRIKFCLIAFLTHVRYETRV